MKDSVLKIILFTTLLLVQICNCHSQNSLNLKLYQNTDYHQQLYYIPVPRENKNEGTLNFSRLSLAFNIATKKGLFHEIELQIPEFSRPLDKLDFPQKYGIWKGNSYTQTGSSFACRYELGKMIGKKSNPINFLVSAALNPYYLKVEYSPTVDLSYYNTRSFYGIALNVVPRLYFRINDRFSIDLNTPLRLYNFRRSSYRIDNPILPARQQRSKQTDHLFLEPVYNFRLGLRYSLIQRKIDSK